MSTGCETSPETSPESDGPDAENSDSHVVPDGDADVVDPVADATNAPDDAQGGGDASDAVEVEDTVVPPPPCLRVEPEGGLDFGLIPGCASWKRTVTLTNCSPEGSPELILREVRVPELWAEQMEVTFPVGSRVMQPGESARFDVNLAPRVAGVLLDSELRVELGPVRSPSRVQVPMMARISSASCPELERVECRDEAGVWPWSYGLSVSSLTTLVCRAVFDETSAPGWSVAWSAGDGGETALEVYPGDDGFVEVVIPTTGEWNVRAWLQDEDGRRVQQEHSVSAWACYCTPEPSVLLTTDSAEAAAALQLRVVRVQDGSCWDDSEVLTSEHPVVWSYAELGERAVGITVDDLQEYFPSDSVPAGRYAIGVWHNPESGGPELASLKTFLLGSLVLERETTLAPGEFWHVATFDSPDGSVTTGEVYASVAGAPCPE